MIDEELPNRVSEPYHDKYRRPVLVRVFGSLFALLFIGAAFIGGILFWAFMTFTAEGPLSADKIVNIDKGLDRAGVAVVLKDQGIISDARVFSAAAALQELRGAKLKAGEYEFPAKITTQDALAMITSGRFLTYKVTIPEGWTSQMVVARLEEQKELEGAIAAVPIEGSILPDTYIFKRGLTRQKLIEDMQLANTKLLDELWAKRPADSILKSKEELLTLASIVEKETGVATERPQVASVFVNRLKKGMRLQSDPTIIYGIVGGKGRLERPITRTDIDTATPYNTYQIPALPPGPIANPGKAALEAVLNPDKTEFLYFVANGTGGHAFATTLEDHNANVKKWRELQNVPDPTIPDAPVPTAVPEPTNTTPQPLPAVETPEPAAPKTAAVKPILKRPPIKKAVKAPVATEEIPPEPSVDVKPVPKKPKSN